MIINIECETTEYACVPDDTNVITNFNINDKSLVISFLDKNNNVLTQSEIGLSDARKLAQIILNA